MCSIHHYTPLSSPRSTSPPLSRHHSFSSYTSSSSSSCCSDDLSEELTSTTCNSSSTTTSHQITTLSFEQVQRLSEVVSESIDINPKEGNFPTLSISPAQLIKAVRKRLDDRHIDIQDVRLNGSAASYCIATDRDKTPSLHYNDLDIIFKIRTKTDYDLHVIKEEVLSSLFDFFPAETQTDRISSYMLEEYYVKKMVKVATPTDKWSLLSLGDANGKNIELKFVDSMKRQYEFSIDSFQIILDPLLSFDEARSGCLSPIKLDPDFYPCVHVLSLFGDYQKAFDHLNERLISTKNPEEIRGGGLLKYCHLQVSGYSIADHNEIEKQEPYMCSRFFIDFPSGNAQYSKIYKYVATRYLQFQQPRRALEFLDTLLHVIGMNARCLMESERYKTMNILFQIQSIITWHFGSNEQQTHFYFSPYHHHHHTTNNSTTNSSSNSSSTTPPSTPLQWQPITGTTYYSTSSRYHSHYNHHHRSHHHHHHHRDSSNLSSPQAPPSPPIIQFPHSSNNALPIGPTPTPVR